MTKYNYLSGRPTEAKKQAGTQDRERECTLRGTKYSEETNKCVHRIVRERERENLPNIPGVKFYNGPDACPQDRERDCAELSVGKILQMTREVLCIECYSACR